MFIQKKQLIPVAVLLALAAFFSCKNDSTPQTGNTEEEKGVSRGKVEVTYECTLSKGFLLGIKVGEPVDTLKVRMNKGLTEDKVKIKDKDVAIYRYTAPNKEFVRIFMEDKNGKKLVSRVEYPGSLCQTDKKVGVSSTLADLRKAYPELSIARNEKTGLVIATAQGWKFLLGVPEENGAVDIATLSEDVRVTAVVLE